MTRAMALKLAAFQKQRKVKIAERLQRQAEAFRKLSWVVDPEAMIVGNRQLRMMNAAADLRRHQHAPSLLKLIFG